MNLFLLKILITYCMVINIVAFAMMGIDKKKAEKRKWRIKEKTLFGLAFIGGSIGSILGMQYFRHKTKHRTFVLGMPAIFILHLLIVIYIVIF